jgi:hypothetical protein
MNLNRQGIQVFSNKPSSKSSARSLSRIISVVEYDSDDHYQSIQKLGIGPDLNMERQLTEVEEFGDDEMLN